MAKQTKKQEVEKLQKLSTLKDQRMAALENGDSELAAKLKAEIAALENGASVSSTSNIDLTKVNITFEQLNEVYSQYKNNEYRSNSETPTKAKAGETATLLGYYTQFDDALFGAFCGLVKVCALFNGKGTNLRAYNMLKAKVFDNIKNFEPLHNELVNLFGDAKRENIDDYKKLSLMAKGYNGAMAILDKFVNMPKEQQPTEPTKEQQPTEPTKDQQPTEPTKEQQPTEPTKEQQPTEPTKEQQPTDKKGKGKQGKK